MFTEDEAPFVAEMMSEYFGGAADEGHRCLVDDTDGLRGVAYYRPKPPADRVWDLTMIAVRPERQGAGLGTALLRRVEDDLRADGQRLLLVDTSGTAQYDRTRAFYAGCGYDEEARVRDYWTTGDDLVVFRKALA
ncbi:GNAT family N-acetyltransferase [Streptomyces sp. NPDC060194]|uniref:GNAT family N-acetyltransferase n=1 Tax=Streptomyces sp. NPDC060194 TaxID=3347069 RepID=UPI003662B3B9